MGRQVIWSSNSGVLAWCVKQPCWLSCACRALSHPNIVQAYTCLTDVAVRDLMASSFRTMPSAVMSSPAYKYLASMEERPCHVEVIEYCDLGNLSTALKYAVFQASTNHPTAPSSSETHSHY